LFIVYFIFIFKENVMKKVVYGFVMAVLVLAAGCDQVMDAITTLGDGDEDPPKTGFSLEGVTLSSVTQTGGVETPFEPTTKVTLTFDTEVEGLAEEYIEFEADGGRVAIKGFTAKGDGVYELAVDALDEEANWGLAFEVTVSDGEITRSDSVTLYTWIEVADAPALTAIGTDATTLSGWYKQTKDITIESEAWAPIGGTTTTAPFTGHFVGSDYIENGEKKNYKIFPTIASSTDHIGIFGYTSEATFENIHIGGGSIKTTGAGKYAGGLAYIIQEGTVVKNCSNAAAVSSTGTGATGGGGICRTANGNSVIDGCWNTGDITGGSVGGICAIIIGTIKNCSNSGNIIVDKELSGTATAGGICGTQTSGEIIACYNSGTVTSIGKARQPTLGGIVGVENTCKITACYNTGTVSTNVAQQSSGRIQLGGIVGRVASSGMVIACYNAGTVEHTGAKADVGVVYYGGIAGARDTEITVITGSYWLATETLANGTGANKTSSTVGLPPDNEGTVKFSDEDEGWPSTTVSNEWGTGKKDGSGSGNYWASLGSYGGSYPRLWFEND
jgi:hypothetical protein